ncbi:MAG: hypothetical protein HQL41_00670 [Alphaproteobacteria bacterium]|nr:hypothetical protein [Alphaproteobacteria bacterium]
MTRQGAVPAITAARARQILLDEWTPLERVREAVVAAWRATVAFYDDLGWWRAPLWPALGWALATVAAWGSWVFAPARLARLAMPVPGAPPPPPWKFWLGVVTFFGWLGATRRPLRAWLRQNRDAITLACFDGRDAVMERARYCPLGHEAEVTAFAAAVGRRDRGLLWIDGVGGSGKTALAIQIVGRQPGLVPVLVNEDWTESLAAQIARQLRPAESGRGPTEAMVKTLGADGLLCPLVDSLSERSTPDAVDQVGRVVADGWFRHLVVTSRKPPPGGQVWERLRRVSTAALTPQAVPAFVATYAALDHVAAITARLAPLLAGPAMPSPLFLRFAIEQASTGPRASIGKLALVLSYVEALRAGKVNLAADDMARAAAIAAVEAVREHLSPRELEQHFLRGVLVAEGPFVDARNAPSVEPAAVVEMLVSSGLLERNQVNRRLRFAYDPVAELLAAWRLSTARAASLADLRDRLAADPNSALAQALDEVVRTGATDRVAIEAG